MSNIGGRPKVISEATVRKLEQAFKDGLSVSEACFVSGIGRRTFYDHKASNADFARKMELAKAYVTLRAKKVVVQSINEGNLTAAKWYLERKARNEFGPQPVDEDDEWNTQVAKPHHAVLKVIAAQLTALEPDQLDEVEPIAMPPIEPVIVQASTSSDDILADLYDD